jgi:chromosome segregation ATPase
MTEEELGGAEDELDEAEEELGGADEELDEAEEELGRTEEELGAMDELDGTAELLLLGTMLDELTVSADELLGSTPLSDEQEKVNAIASMLPITLPVSFI